MAITLLISSKLLKKILAQNDILQGGARVREKMNIVYIYRTLKQSVQYQ